MATKVVYTETYKKDTAKTKVFEGENSNGKGVSIYVPNEDFASIGSPDAIKVTIEAA